MASIATIATNKKKLRIYHNLTYSYIYYLYQYNAMETKEKLCECGMILVGYSQEHVDYLLRRHLAGKKHKRKLKNLGVMP